MNQQISDGEVASRPMKMLVLQALAHGSALLAMVALLIWLDASVDASTASWKLFAAAAVAFVSGLGLSHIVHEWGHYLGAICAGAAVDIKARIAPLFFDFDFSKNSSAQFLAMSLCGLAGNMLLLAVALWWVAPPGLVASSLLAAVSGQFVFVLLLELPVSVGVLRGGGPWEVLGSHFGQGAPLFLGALVAGVAVAALVLVGY